jgi:nucleoside-diphosphate-sugar epimerase
MSEKIILFGYGAVGQAVVQQLSDAGRPVTVAQRSRPAALPPLATYLACDVKDLAATKTAVAGASAVICAIGLTYDSAIWSCDWPVVMGNLLEACTAAGARLVFVDNLYMYGPQTQPLTEDMALTTYGIKPRIRAEITKMWQAAHAAGKVKVVAVRASDFYGPGVTQSVLGETGLAAMAKGKPALLLGAADLLHDLAYVPDVARATITLLDAPMDAYGQAWHVPCAPTRTYRQVLQIGADALGQKLKFSGLPPIMLGLLGLFMPILREMKEMRFQSDRPYHVDASRFAKRFWSDATPFEVGVAKTAKGFVASS